MMKRIFIVALVICTNAISKAQAPQNHELSQLINRSFGYYPNIKEAECCPSAQQRLELTEISNLPTLSGEASYAYVMPKIVLPIPSGSNGEVKDFQFAAVNNYGAMINGSYTLADFGRLKANIEKAKTDLQISKHNIDYNKSMLALVSTIYYNIIFFKKSIEIRTASSSS
jgi:outer membrane protein TolC